MEKLNKMKNRPFVNFIVGLFILVILGCTPTNENQLFYVQAGTGETILFIHGAQEDYRAFAPQLELLKADYKVISFSRRYNYPNASKYQEGVPYSPKTEAEDLETLINSLKVKSVHIVGHSYGGLVAMEYTHKNPDRVQSLTLSEPPLLQISGCNQWYQVAQKGLIENVGAAFKTNDTTQVMKAIFEFFVGADIQEQLPPEVLQPLKANLSEMEALVNSDDPFPAISTDFKTPVMLITTGNTMPMLKCTNEALVKQMPKAKHIHLPDASHEMWMTHPEILSTHLRNFISGVHKGNTE